MSIDIEPPATQCDNLVELLRHRAKHDGDRIAFTYHDLTDSLRSLTYADIDHHASRIARSLSNAAGERAALLFPTGPEFLCTFFGCMYAGVIAVPLKPPRPNRPAEYLDAILRSATPRYLLHLDDSLTDTLTSLSTTGVLDQCRPIDYRQLQNDTSRPTNNRKVTSATIAMLQYTSGSTTTPRGVVLAHENLMANLHAIRTSFGLTQDCCSVTWLPHYHDMGLIGTLLAPILTGSPVHVLSPLDFLRQPLVWIETISRVGAQISGGPNFAFQLCVDSIAESRLSHLNLDCWRLAFNGAEPVQAQTIRHFCAKFGDVGFRANSFYPCYGLAESTLLVSGPPAGTPPVLKSFLKQEIEKGCITASFERTSDNAEIEDSPPSQRVLVSCGRPVPETDIAIIEPTTETVLADGLVGEIVTSSRSITSGYWMVNSLPTVDLRLGSHPSRRWLRTGDLGFLWEGELYVTGRIKDLLIVQGVNHYPQDIERTITNSHPQLREGRSAVFDVTHEGTSQIIVVHESRQLRSAKDIDGTMVDALRTAVNLHHDLSVHNVVFTRPGQMPVTTSGKIQRSLCRRRYLNREWRTIYDWSQRDAAAGAPAQSTSRTQSPSVEIEVPLGADQSLGDRIEHWLIHKIAELVGTTADTILPLKSFATFGLDSVRIVAVARDLEQYVGHSLSPTLLYEFATPRKLAVYLANRIENRPAAEHAFVTASPAVHANSCNSPTGSRSFEPIAIIGMGCRFPQASGLTPFWRLLCEGQRAIVRWPDDRPPVSTGNSAIYTGGYLSGCDMFAAQHFGISPREANMMDPQQRLLLEVAWEALLDAGILPQELGESRTGVFIGISQCDYAALAQQSGVTDFFLSTGNATSIAANRISFQLGLQGPSLSIDTACSSSLVAVHQACRSLQDGESTMAIAGGVNLILSPLVTSVLAQGKMISIDGVCRAFDKDANGYVRGEGVGVVVLKTLADAVRDGDPIYCTINGTSVGQDGHANGLTAPNPAAQRAVIQAALTAGRIAAESVDYVEAHGTGTSLGDPIEARILGESLCHAKSRRSPLLIGSVKTNIGHLESAAGIAGLIKAALMLDARQIVPSLGFQVPNPLIPFDELQMRVATENSPWPKKSGLPMAGVSSFGFGGTNAHAVLAACEPTARSHQRSRLPYPEWKRQRYWFTQFNDRPTQAHVESSHSMRSESDMRSEAVMKLAEILVVPSDQIDPDRPLPELGVDSIMAMELLDSLRASTSLDIPLASIADAPSLNQLLDRLALTRRSESPVPCSNDESPPLQTCEASRTQQELWMLGTLANAPTIWNLAVRLDCHGLLDMALLQHALNMVVDRHEALRTTIALENGRLLQTVHTSLPISIQVVDLSTIQPSRHKAFIDQELDKITRTPIELTTAPLLRVTVLRLDAERTVLGIVVSHLIADGWSMRLLNRELWQAYELLRCGRGSDWSRLAKPFRAALLERQHAKLNDRTTLATIDGRSSSGDGGLCESESLSAEPQGRAGLPYDSLPAEPAWCGQRYTWECDPGLSAQIIESSRRSGVTPFITFVTGIAAVLARYNENSDLRLHVAIAGRDTIDQTHVVGPLFDILPITLDIDQSLPIAANAANGRAAVNSAQAAFTQQSASTTNPVRQRMQVLVDYQDQSTDRRETSALHVTATELDNGTAMAEVAICLRRLSHHFSGYIQFNTTLYRPETIARFVGHLETLLRVALSSADTPLKHIDILTEVERQRWHEDVNATNVQYDTDALIDELIEAQSIRSPNDVAILCEDNSADATQLTYRELWQHVDAISRYLAEIKQVQRGDRIAILLPRNIMLVPTMIGVLRAGAAYVPIDPHYPMARQQAILANADVSCIITNKLFASRVPTGIPLIDVTDLGVNRSVDIRSDGNEQSRNQGQSRIGPQRCSQDTAYILYTSGSTGVPKGVVVSHRNVHNFFVGMDALQTSPAPGTWLAITSVGFDISVFELLWTIARGYRVILHPGGTSTITDRVGNRDRRWSVAHTMSHHGVTHLQCTPAFAKMLVDDPDAHDPMRALRHLFVGGDVLPLDLANQLSQLVGGEVYNMYGPTETTVWSTAYRLPRNADCVAIGRPLANTRVLVLDRSLSQVPANVPGELYIGGDGVSDGYFRDDQRTNERFRTSSIEPTHSCRDVRGRTTDERLFRTGDRVQYTAAGELLFLGRIDNQVKIHGQRIELAEIELAMVAHRAIRQAIVVARPNSQGDQELHAFVRVDAETEFDPIDVRQFLLRRLPSAVVPADYTVLAALPLTSNGKIDRRSLVTLPIPPKPQKSPADCDNARAPDPDRLLAIRNIVAAELQLPDVPESTDPLSLGVTSIEILRIANRLEETYGSRPPLMRFFEGESIESVMMSHLSQLETARDTRTIRSISVKGEHVSADAAIVGQITVPVVNRADSDVRGNMPEGASVFDRLAKRRRNRRIASSTSTSNIADGSIPDNPFAKYVEPIKSDLLARVGLDISYVRGEGCYLWDTEGRRYLDFIAQYGGLPFGYNSTPMWEALYEVHAQQRPNVATNSLLPTAGELSKALLTLAPQGLTHVTFCNSGAEATEVAIKLARAATGRPGVISAHRSFHGLTLAALAATGEPDFQRPFQVDEANFAKVPYGELTAVEQLIAQRPGFFALMLVEPIQGEGGIIEPPAGYLSALRQICNQHGIMLAFDEVQTGLGRTGSLFACECDNVAPDILLLAKALGGGLMPIGAVLSNDCAYSDRFGLRHSSTFAGNALACNVGLASLRQLTANDSALIRHVRHTGAFLKDRLRAIAAKYPTLVAAIRGRGYMQAIEFSFESLYGTQGLLGVLAEQQSLIHLVVAQLHHVYGIRIAPTFTGRSVMRIEPPLIATQAQCEEFLAGLDGTLSTLEAGDTAALLAPVAGKRDDELRSFIRQSQQHCLVTRKTIPARTVAGTDNSHAADPGRSRFGFVIHMASLDDLVTFDRSLQLFSTKDLAKIKSRLLEDAEPMIIGEASICSGAGKRVDGTFILVPYTPHDLTRMDRDDSVGLIQQAVALAAAEDVDVIGLGGFTSILTAGGLALDTSGLPQVTSGNAFTAAAILRAVNNCTALKERSLNQSTAAVLGATGQIGRVVSLLLAEQVSRLILVGSSHDRERTIRRLRSVAEATVAHLVATSDQTLLGTTPISYGVGRLHQHVSQMAGAFDAVRPKDLLSWVDRLIEEEYLTLAESLDEALEAADVIVTATSAVEPFLDARHFKPGAIVCDASRPANVISATLQDRPDLAWIEGGVIKVPGNPGLKMYAGPQADRVFACVAETILLALEPELRSSRVVEHIEPGMVRQLDLAAIRHGFEVIS